MSFTRETHTFSTDSKVMAGAADYPVRFMHLDHPPASLWCRGRLPAAPRAVAIVGSRSASGAGLDRTRALSAAFVRRGWDVVSGGAFGIDAAAHEGALEADGGTFAVLGCGIDVVYPDRHGPLFDRIARSRRGGLLTEYPPGTPPRTFHFPQRNRLVAALVDAVVVVEAAPRSGALITAKLARKAGRPVFACSGSAGTDALLSGGETFRAASAEAIEEIVVSGAAAPEPLFASTPPAGPVAAIVAALANGAADPAALSRRVGLPLSRLMGILTEAELDGWVRRGAGNLFERGHGN